MCSGRGPAGRTPNGTPRRGPSGACSAAARAAPASTRAHARIPGSASSKRRGASSTAANGADGTDGDATATARTVRGQDVDCRREVGHRLPEIGLAWVHSSAVPLLVRFELAHHSSTTGRGAVARDTQAGIWSPAAFSMAERQWSQWSGSPSRTLRTQVPQMPSRQEVSSGTPLFRERGGRPRSGTEVADDAIGEGGLLQQPGEGRRPAAGHKGGRNSAPWACSSYAMASRGVIPIPAATRWRSPAPEVRPNIRRSPSMISSVPVRPCRAEPGSRRASCPRA